MVQDFEARHPRRYWAFGAERSAEQSIWNQAVKAEAHVGAGNVTGGFCEGRIRVLRVLPIDHAQRAFAGSGPAECGGQGRFQFLARPAHPPSWDGSQCRPAACFARAACGVAYALEPFDEFLERNRDVDLASYVDDDTVTAYGSPDHVAGVL
eukprot:5371417-Pyramimonas_sp.AAC.1